MDTAPSDRWLLPEGIEEVLPREAQRLERLRRRLLDVFDTWGYELVLPPFIDFLDSLLIGTGRDLDSQTFKLTDQLSGRLLGVRADMTPQVARIDAHHWRSDQPSRLCYLGTVLHTRGDHLEKSRSPMQIGAELYGHSGPASDLEIVRLLLEVLSQAGLSDIHLDLGHVAIYRTLAARAGLNADQEAALFDVLQRKAAAELAELLERYGVTTELRTALLALPTLNGGLDVLQTAQAQLADLDPAIAAALAQLDFIARDVHARCPDLPIHIDLAELRGYHYQTGVVFAAFVPGYGKEVARGGRYDEIGKVFGSGRPATGFSADLKVLARLSASSDNDATRPAIFAPLDSDPALAAQVRDLRAAGWRVIEALPGQADAAATALACTQQLTRDATGAWTPVPI